MKGDILRQRNGVQKIKLGPLYYEISLHNPPGITIMPGETLAVETEGAFSGQIRKIGNIRDIIAMLHDNP